MSNTTATVTALPQNLKSDNLCEISWPWGWIVACGLIMTLLLHVWTNAIWNISSFYTTSAILKVPGDERKVALKLQFKDLSPIHGCWLWLPKYDGWFLSYWSFTTGTCKDIYLCCGLDCLTLPFTRQEFRDWCNQDIQEWIHTHEQLESTRRERLQQRRNEESFTLPAYETRRSANSLPVPEFALSVSLPPPYEC